MIPPKGQATHVKPIPRVGCSHYHEEETRQPINRSAVALAYRLSMPRCQMGGVGVHHPPHAEPGGHHPRPTITHCSYTGVQKSLI